MTSDEFGRQDRDRERSDTCPCGRPDHDCPCLQVTRLPPRLRVASTESGPAAQVLQFPIKHARPGITSPEAA